MIRSLLSVIVGLIAGIFTWVVCFAILFGVGKILAPDQFVLPADWNISAMKPPDVEWFLPASLVVDGLAAIVIGFVAAWIGKKAPTKMALILGVIITLGAAGTMIQEQDKLPVWVSVTRIIVMFPGVLIGARIRKMFAKEEKDEEKEED